MRQIYDLQVGLHLTPKRLSLRGDVSWRHDMNRFQSLADH
jgi:hypothetical protein